MFSILPSMTFPTGLLLPGTAGSDKVKLALLFLLVLSHRETEEGSGRVHVYHSSPFHFNVVWSCGGVEVRDKRSVTRTGVLVKTSV